ncbi:MAG: ROK family protein [Micropepsaceae bacterium]
MRIGIDLGGTKIEGVILGAGHSIAARKRVATPQGDYEGTVAAIAALVQDLTQQAPTPAATPVGISMPGALSLRSGLVKNANSTCLIGKPLDRDLAAALGRPVRLANDANCFALSEAIDGAAAGHRVVFGVILGTGVGGGLIVDGKPLVGPNAIAGEWGHNPLPWPDASEAVGRQCYCGKTGCIETWISGPAFAAGYADERGINLTAEEIVSAARSGEACAEAAIERVGQRIGKCLASVVNIVDPDIIVLGGGLSNIEALYGIIPEALTRHAFSDGVSTPVVRAKHGDSSGVRGAAWLWNES